MSIIQTDFVVLPHDLPRSNSSERLVKDLERIVSMFSFLLVAEKGFARNLVTREETTFPRLPFGLLRPMGCRQLPGLLKD